MGLDHKAVQAKVHCPLGQFLKILPGASHVARIGEERDLGIPGAELHGDLPSGEIAVRDLLGRGEAAMDHAQFPDPSPVQSLKSSNPEIKIRINRVLD